MAWGRSTSRSFKAPIRITCPNLAKILNRPVRVGVVAQGDDRALEAAQQVCSCLVTFARAAGDVASRDDDRRVGVLWGENRSEPQPKAVRVARMATMITVAVLPAPMPPSARQVSTLIT